MKILLLLIGVGLIGFSISVVMEATTIMQQIMAGVLFLAGSIYFVGGVICDYISSLKPKA